MTDDATRSIETPATPAAEPAPGAMSGDGSAVPPAPTAPVPGTPLPGANRTRWAIGLGVAGLAIVGAVAAFVLFGAQSSPEALRYIPGDAAAVMEVRLDLPGDQLQHLGNLLAHFPGFADQSTLAEKIDEALSKFLEMASEGETDYVTDIKPWLAGPAFIGMPALTAGRSTDDAIPLVSATTNGAVDCATALGGTVTHETYRGLDLVTDTAEFGFACVVDGRQALFGEPAAVRAALDAKADGTGMDKSAAYQKARSTLGGDRLATAYFNGAALQELMPQPSGPGIPAIPGIDSLTGSLPEWFMGGVRAEDDALVVDFVAAPVPQSTAGPSLLPIPAAHGSVITGMVPANTLLYVEAQGVGVGLQNLLTMLREIPDLQAPLQMLDGAGGAGQLVGWIDDLGIAVSTHGTTPDVAIMLVGKDETTVATTFGSLKTLLGLAGMGGGGITVSETTVNGIAVTNITITDLGTLIPPGTIPGGTLPTTTGPVTFSIAARNRTLIVATGEAAMTAVLTTAAGSSLADQAAFKQASARGLANSQATVYLGVGASVDLVKGFLPAEVLATYQAEVAPYVDPLEAVLMSSTSDASGSHSRLVFTVTKP